MDNKMTSKEKLEFLNKAQETLKLRNEDVELHLADAILSYNGEEIIKDVDRLEVLENAAVKLSTAIKYTIDVIKYENYLKIKPCNCLNYIGNGGGCDPHSENRCGGDEDCFEYKEGV